MSLEPEQSSQSLAVLIIDALHDAGIVTRQDLGRATAIAAEEIAVRKVLGDYWCSRCEFRQPRADGDPGA